MRRLLTQNKPDFIRTIVDMSRSKYPFIRQPAERFKASTDEIENIISNAITQTQFLDDPAIVKVLGGLEPEAKSDMQMYDLRAHPCTVFVILPARYMTAYARFFRLLVVAALDQLSQIPDGNRTLMILDEFPVLGHLSAIETAFGLARGYNLQLWPFVQDLNQLRDIYGDRWQSFVANAGVVQWFTPNDPFTAGVLSARIGDTTVGTIELSENIQRGTNLPGSGSPGHSHGESFNKNYKLMGVPLFSVQDLMDLPDYLQILTLAGCKYPVLLTREHYYDWKGGPFAPLLELLDPDPFHPKG